MSKDLHSHIIVDHTVEGIDSMKEKLNGFLELISRKSEMGENEFRLEVGIRKDFKPSGANYTPGKDYYFIEVKPWDEKADSAMDARMAIFDFAFSATVSNLTIDNGPALQHGQILGENNPVIKDSSAFLAESFSTLAKFMDQVIERSEQKSISI